MVCQCTIIPVWEDLLIAMEIHGGGDVLGDVACLAQPRNVVPGHSHGRVVRHEVGCWNMAGQLLQLRYRHNYYKYL